METSVSLLERLRTQPNDADWQRLTDLYQPLILRWLRRLAPSLRYHDIEDLAQEVLQGLVRGLERFEWRGNGSFRGWLQSILSNKLKAHWRSLRNRPAPLHGEAAESQLAQFEDPQSELAQQWERDHHQHVVDRGLELIKEEFQPTTWQAFWLVTFDGLEAAGAAERLGISEGAVYTNASRVRKRLREEIQDLLG